VLTRVYKNVGELVRAPLQRRDHRRGLHEIRSCANDRENFYGPRHAKDWTMSRREGE
jgi:hypothetical protein